MKKLEDYKGQKIAIHFPTYGLWLRRKEINPSDDLEDFDWKNGYIYYTPFERDKKGDAYISSSMEIQDNYTILQATDFLEEEFIYGQEYEFSDDEEFKNFNTLRYLCKRPDGKFIGYSEFSNASITYDYCRKINTERTEAITTIKELVSKFSINQNEVF